MGWFEAVGLGLVQGLTEFLPSSSLAHLRIVVTHMLPNAASHIIVVATLAVPLSIIGETTLSFLGLGDPSKESWGRMIANAFERSAVSTGAWWAIVPPGLAIAFVVVSCTLIGRGLEEILNPRLNSSNISVKPFEVELVPPREPLEREAVPV